MPLPTNKELEEAKYWIVSTPRQCGKSHFQKVFESAHRKVVDEAWPRWCDHFEQEYQQVGVDPAKPGADRTVVYPINDNLANPAGRASPADLAKPCAPVQPDPEHIWNMVVLAARASRYE